MLSSTSLLDGTEVLHFENCRQPFPEHFHETYCISLIESGTEGIRSNGQTRYHRAGSISISTPYEVHANPVVNAGAGVSFTTLYVHQEVVNALLGKSDAWIARVQSDSTEAIPLLRDVFRAFRTAHQPGAREIALRHFLRLLRLDEHPGLENPVEPNAAWLELHHFIENQLTRKIQLDTLARRMYLDKFHFAKEFRKRYGLSPMNYVLMRKVFAAKQLLQTDARVVDCAYAYDFTDAAHFSRHFKRFVGMSPGQYRRLDS